MARRRYGRRRGGGRKSFLSKVGGISGLGGTIYAAERLGATAAANTLIQTGDIGAAAHELSSRASIGNMIGAVLPVMLILGAKKVARSAGVRIPAWI